VLAALKTKPPAAVARPWLDLDELQAIDPPRGYGRD